MRLTNCFVLYNPCSRTRPLRFTQPLTEMSKWGRKNVSTAGVISESIVLAIWNAKHLTALQVSTACYGDSFTFTLILGLIMEGVYHTMIK
jgi:hypothetical protein